jgi:hypothetical protein
MADINTKWTQDNDDLPFKCLVSRDTFKDPTATKRRHYYCDITRNQLAAAATSAVIRQMECSSQPKMF